MGILGRDAQGRGRWNPLPQDFAVAFLSLLFSILSLVFPDTGAPAFGWLPRGYLMGLVFGAVLLLSLLFPFLGEEAPPLLRFVRTFYPQLLLPLFFGESILLSVEISRGRAFDDLIASIDHGLFGFQPARRFHESLQGFPAVNELMFAGYFLFYVLFAITPWISYFAGDREEAEREIFIFLGMMTIIFVWYLFFRVEGPKYWFPDLRAESYREFRGGPFVEFFQGIFKRAPLYGAAFPSSHVAFSLAVTIFVWRSRPRLLWLYVPAFLLVSTATVYIYAHYFADVLGGIVAALLLEPPLRKLHGRLSRSSRELP